KDTENKRTIEFVNVSFKPIDKAGFKGYLGDLKYYYGPKAHTNRSSIQANEFNPATIVKYYSTGETDNFIETYKKKFPERTAYPKTLSYRVDKNKIDSNNKLETFTEVFVPVMEAISPKSGTKRMILKFDLSNALNEVSNTQPTPANPAETTTTVTQPTPKPETPENTQPADKPTDSGTTKPTETVNPVEPPKPTEPAKPVKPVVTPNPAEPAKPVKPVVTTPTPKPTPSATATYYKGVKATLLNAYRPGQKSMGDAALEHSNVTVFKEGSTFHYIVRFHDLSTYGFTGGISKFWVNGTEYAVNPTGGSNNQVEVHFTSTEKLYSVPVSVFVQAMEEIMQGGGRQNATLSFDWSSVTEQQGQPISGGNPGSSGYTPSPSSPGGNQGEQPTSPIATPATPLPAASQEQGVEVPVTYFDNVTASLLNAYESGRASMGNAALDGITVFKHGDTYHYKVRFHDIKVGTLTDGITRFWVNGTEYPVNRTGGAMNQVEVHFTSPEKLTNIPVSVFVPTMESIMPGAGKKDAVLSLNWSNATERQGTAVIDGGQPGASGAGNGASALTPKGGRLNNGRLSNTGLETSSSILAGALTLMSAFMVGRRKEK
ncbi:MAG: hypothetical protein E7J16_02515, partial [Gemella haemolysans]|nr:hypothetical protein [Gemella haemolysans]